MLGVGINIGIPARRRVGFRGVLDDYTPTAAFSLRRLRTAYTGALVRVWRSKDNAEMDIGYTANQGLAYGIMLA